MSTPQSKSKKWLGRIKGKIKPGGRAAPVQQGGDEPSFAHNSTGQAFGPQLTGPSSQMHSSHFSPNPAFIQQPVGNGQQPPWQHITPVPLQGPSSYMQAFNPSTQPPQPTSTSFPLPGSGMPSLGPLPGQTNINGSVSTTTVPSNEPPEHLVPPAAPLERHPKPPEASPGPTHALPNPVEECLAKHNLGDGLGITNAHEALLLAAEHGNLELLGPLLALGAHLLPSDSDPELKDRNDPDTRWRSPLHAALAHREFGFASAVLSRYLADPSVGVSGARLVNLTDSHSHKTPLSLAAELGATTTVEALVAVGADIEAKDSMDRTPLQLAAKTGSLAVVKFLVLRGANLDAMDKEGRNAFYRALLGDHEASAQELAAAGGHATLTDALDHSKRNKTLKERGITVPPAFARNWRTRAAGSAANGSREAGAVDLGRESPSPPSSVGSTEEDRGISPPEERPEPAERAVPAEHADEGTFDLRGSESLMLSVVLARLTKS